MVRRFHGARRRADQTVMTAPAHGDLVGGARKKGRRSVPRTAVRHPPAPRAPCGDQAAAEVTTGAVS
ncbi:hypothetical protein SFR_1663 [Streptomyces sp. FR-008]|nr:hypothetical protein SFR_1663 [Streptomyces sp. FR-008]